MAGTAFGPGRPDRAVLQDFLEFSKAPFDSRDCSHSQPGGKGFAGLDRPTTIPVIYLEQIVGFSYRGRIDDLVLFGVH